MFKQAITIFTLLLALCNSQPLSLPQGSYVLTALAPGTALDGQAINAAGQTFFIGLNGPHTFCPWPGLCSEGNVTLVDEKMSSLRVTVPGGQQIYVTYGGTVAFTMPHSTAVPPGSTQGGFFVTAQQCASTGGHVFAFDWASSIAPDFSGLVACPNAMAGVVNTPWVIKVRAPGANLTMSCTQLDGLAVWPSDQRVSAYEYI